MRTIPRTVQPAIQSTLHLVAMADPDVTHDDIVARAYDPEVVTFHRFEVLFLLAQLSAARLGR